MNYWSLFYCADEDLQAVSGTKGVSGPFSPLEGFAWELKLRLGLSSANIIYGTDTKCSARWGYQESQDPGKD